MQDEAATIKRKEDLEQNVALDSDTGKEDTVQNADEAPPGKTGDSLKDTNPELSSTQMEILELEMRARAIKAMLEKRKAAALNS